MTSKRGRKKKRITSQKARRWIGHPVCVVLNNGNYYVGTVKGIEKGKLILNGAKGRGKISSPVRSKGKVQVSGLLQLLFGGGGFAPAGPTDGGETNAGVGGGNFFGTLRQMWPNITFGIQMVKTIMPLMGAFKI